MLNLAGLMLAGAVATVAVGCSGGDQQQMQQMAPSIATITLAEGTSDLESSFPALIKGKSDVAIRPQVTGFITKVCVDEGQQVSKGQTLFILDQVQFQAAVDQAVAAVNAAQTAVSTAQMTADTKKKLYDKNIISEYEWQLASNQLMQARAALAQAEAALTTARKNLAYTTVTSPSDGVVGTIPNREGSLASPSSAQPLTTVSDNSEVYAYFSLTEKDLLDLTEGGNASITQRIASMPEVNLVLADGTNYPLTGKVATVSGVIDNATGSASVRALFKNPSGMLRSGNTGSVYIPVRSENVITIPQKSTFEVQDLRYVFTLNDSNITRTTPVKVLPENDGKIFVVTEGLKPGDRVVTEGIGTIVRDGMPIRPKQSAAPAAN